MIEYFILINLITGILFGIDKFLAIRHKFRIPERALLTFLVIGGCLGGIIGMYLFHHKTKKKLFQVIAILATILWITIFAGIYF